MRKHVKKVSKNQYTKAVQCRAQNNQDSNCVLAKKGVPGTDHQMSSLIYRAVSQSDVSQRKRPAGPWFRALCLTRLSPR